VTHTHSPPLPAKRLAVILSTLMALVLAGPALAQSWSSFGGDPGRSGHQPADSPVTAVRLLYTSTGPQDQGVVTSVITTSGPPGREQVVYGTADGRVHLRRLLDGQPVGPPGGIDISDETDAFSSTPGAGFADASSPAALGQVYVAHNDAQGVAVAQIDEATGELVQRVPVAAGYTLRSSVLLSPAVNGDGDRALLFVAIKDKPEPVEPFPAVGGNVTGTDGRMLFKVTITRAHLREAGIGPVTDTGGISANPDASPTLIYMTANNHTKEPFVLVGTSTGRVLSFSVATLSPGPQHSTGGQYDRALTPAVPVTPSGLPPGAEGSGRTSAPHFFLASTDGKATLLHRVIRPDYNRLRFAVEDSQKLPGAPGLALATNQLSVPEGSSAGLVYVGTDKNLYALDATSLSVQAQLSPADLPSGAGFGHTAPTVTGNLVFVSRDNGEQLVLDSRTLQPVRTGVFSQDPGNRGARASFGQVAIAHHRQVVFASDSGLFVYALK
jgi:hypothetical protein